MILFVDASALVAIIRREPDALALLAVLRTADTRLISGLALWEVVRAVAKGSDDDIDGAHEETEQFRTRLNITVVPIGATEAAEAIKAHRRYGKNRHPARLNIGDCFAYACAKTNGANLLYKGDDFARTDLA